MKNLVLLHGLYGNPDNFWFAWLKDQVLQKGWKVTAPQLPDPDHPNLSVNTPFVLEHVGFDSETIIVGHSAGCPLLLSVLDHLKAPVFRSILVAGFIRLEGMQDDDVMLLKPSDWGKIRTKGREFFFFNSDNDPWGCNQHQGEALREKLGGTAIVRTGDGHFGSKKFEQPYPTFPLLRDVCLLD